MSDEQQTDKGERETIHLPTYLPVGVASITALPSLCKQTMPPRFHMGKTDSFCPPKFPLVVELTTSLATL